MKEHSFYLKDNRELCGDSLLGVAGENLCDCISIKVPLFWGEVDLSTAEFSLAFHNPKNFFSEFLPANVVIDDGISVYFGVGYEMCAVAGEVKIQLIARVNDEVVLKSKYAKMSVSESAIDEEEVSAQFPNEFAKIKDKADKVKNPVGSIAGLDSDGNLCDSALSLEELDGGFIRILKNGEQIMIFRSNPLNINSWQDVKTIVRSGQAKKYFKLGDVLSCQKGDKTLYWEVIDFDKDVPVEENCTHSMTLLLTEIFSPFQVDVAQALFVCEKEYEKGSFSLEIGEDLYYFTTQNAMPEGAQVLIGKNLDYVVIYKDCYNNSKIEKCTLNLAQKGESGEVNVAELFEKLTPLNNLNFAHHGRCDYLSSPLKLWLNSEKKDWWEPFDKYSREHYCAKTHSGFLYEMEKDFLDAVGSVKKKTLCYDGQYKESDEKFFILSAGEAFGNFSPQDGERYSAFLEGSDLKRSYNGTIMRWRLRTPRITMGTSFWDVDQNGNMNHATGDNKDGVLPACCIV